MGIDKFNHEGYSAPTTYEALTNIHREEVAADKKAAYLPLVYVCSPYAGDIENNVKNAKVYSRFAVDKNAIPVTPHLLYPQFMDDGNDAEREMAMHFNYVNLGEEDWRNLDIIQVADQKITAVLGNYFLVLNENKKNDTYKIQKIINLHPYGMAYYYNEESTTFLPSKDGEKYLIYNGSRTDEKDQTINAKDDKDLKSIVIDLKKDQVTYRKGNHLENLKKKEGLSENNYPKIAKFSKDIKQYAKKKNYELMTNYYIKSGKDKIWVMKPFYEDNILAGRIYRYHDGKIQCIFKFEQ